MGEVERGGCGEEWMEKGEEVFVYSRQTREGSFVGKKTRVR